MDVFTLSDRTRVLPVLHGSGDFSVEVRRRLLAEPFDCLAVPLPPSLQEPVEQGVAALPGLSCVVEVVRPEPEWAAREWTPEDDANGGETRRGAITKPAASIVPIDPCQPVIAALRVAIPERIPRAFIDAEQTPYRPAYLRGADAYALKAVSLDVFDAALLPMISRPRDRVVAARYRHLAARLRQLETHYERIVFVCGLAEWPWVFDAYHSAEDFEAEGLLQEVEPDPPLLARVKPETTVFLTEELPFVVGRYEQTRAELEADQSQSVDGLKELLLAAREAYLEELGPRAAAISPQTLRVCLKYMRNLSLVERRLTPDMYTIVTAARQTAGDTFARHVLTLSQRYPFALEDDWVGQRLPEIELGLDRLQLPDGDVVPFVSRLPRGRRQWRSLDLRSEPPREQTERWEQRWNPFRQCSWPPEDVAIERFRTAVKDHAISLLGQDLARTEKFSTSLKDGLDIRETLRNWHTGDLYVQELPPNVGSLDCVVMLFDTPADPRDYPYRLTWHAEHHDESTLGFYATAPQENVVGPGIALARYGGAMFLFPPRPVPEIWTDRRLDYCDTLEERLLAAGCLHSREKHVALLAPGPPGIGWKRLARRYGKRLISVPTARFSQQTLQQLRMFHVLNGREVRTYAADFIRKA